MLMKIVEADLREKKDWSDARAQQALAAALVHDIGHGPFSHAFEEVGKRLNIKMAKHEHVSELLIKDSEITEHLKRMGSGFHNDVADVIDDKVDATIYSAVVSSQFDADRLDYMRRDRLMCGTGHGAIDFNWLMDNIEIGDLASGVDGEQVSSTRTFVLGSKALFAAEAYVLGLFQLYPTVYFHKTTRGAEKLFTELLCKVVELSISGDFRDAGLNANHPIVKFARNTDSIESVLSLDDEVLWGSLERMVTARNPIVSQFSKRLRDRNLFKAIDVRQEVLRLKPKGALDRGEVSLEIDAICEILSDKIKGWISQNPSDAPRVLVDKGERSPYKEYDESKGPLNQINIRTSNDELDDLKNQSQVVSAIEPFKMYRVYIANEDDEAKKFIRKIIKTTVDKGKS